MMLRIEAPHYVAGLIIHDGICTEAAPILRWAIGKDVDYLLRYFNKKGFDVTRMWS